MNLEDYCATIFKDCLPATHNAPWDIIQNLESTVWELLDTLPEEYDISGGIAIHSFGQRYQIDRNRKVVQRYSDSFVASSGHLREELKRRLESSDAQDDKHRSSQTTRQGFNAGEAASPPANIKPLSVPKRNFSEPPGRKYNPYS